MTKEELIRRNKKFVIGVIQTVESLPGNRVYDGLVRQVVRSSSSIGANYRAACRAKSKADFINKLKIVEEEADETIYFLELLEELDKNRNNENFKIFNKRGKRVIGNICSVNKDDKRQMKLESTQIEIVNRKSYIVND